MTAARTLRGATALLGVAVIGYGIFGLLHDPYVRDPLDVLEWGLAGLVLHDGVWLPCVALVGAALRRMQARRGGSAHAAATSGRESVPGRGSAQSGAPADDDSARGGPAGDGPAPGRDCARRGGSTRRGGAALRGGLVVAAALTAVGLPAVLRAGADHGNASLLPLPYLHNWLLSLAAVAAVVAVLELAPRMPATVRAAARRARRWRRARRRQAADVRALRE